MTTYCASCGQANKYDFVPPKFCAHCGVPFGSVLASPKSPEKKPIRKVARRQPEPDYEDDIYDDDDEEDEVQFVSVSRNRIKQPKKSSVTIEVESYRDRIVNAKDIIGTSKGDDNDGFKRPPADFQKWKDRVNSRREINIGGDE